MVERLSEKKSFIERPIPLDLPEVAGWKEMKILTAADKIKIAIKTKAYFFINSPQT